MTKAQVVAQVEKGGLFLIGEFRHGKAETRGGVSTTTGKAYEFTSARCAVETEGVTYMVSMDLPKGTPTESWQPPYEKGDAVAVKVTALVYVKGMASMRGVIEKLT